MPERKRHHHTAASEDGGDRRRAFWSGTLSFGLVSIPVELVPANRSGGAPLHMVDAEGTPLRRKYFSPEGDEELTQDTLTHGYELDDGTVVEVTDAELESVDPKKSRDIDLARFVDKDEVDPLYFERSYFLAPGSTSGKAYQLLAEVMEAKNRAGIARFVMRDREYIVAIFAEKGLLRAETLRFAEEVRTPKDVGLSKAGKASPKRVAEFARAIESLESDRLATADLTDDHAEAIKDLAKKKLAKKKDVVHAEASSQGTSDRPNAQVIDLMAVLKKSLEESGLSKSSSRSVSKKAPAKRKAAKKAGAARGTSRTAAKRRKHA